MTAKHLIHIGYPKAGSTFLQAWFEQHPDLCYAPGGLGGFYNIYDICRPSGRACEYFVTSFEGIATPHESAGDFRLDFARQDFSPGPIKKEQKAVCSTLRSLYPESRILIVTRGFKGLIVSGYSQYLRAGGVLHLEQFCKSLVDCLTSDEYNYFDFDYLIQLYADAFGEENLIVLPYELLRDNQPGFLSTLEAQLEVKHIEPAFGRLNPSLSPEELYWYPVISRTVAALVSRSGEARFQRVYRWYIGKTMENKFRRAIRMLQRLKPDRRVTEVDLPVKVLDYCKGKAARLKNNPLYAPYYAEYLWNSQEGSHEDLSPSRQGEIQGATSVRHS